MAPLSVSVPAPSLVRASVPVVFCKTPVKLPPASLLPTVSVTAPATVVSTTPAPDRPLIVSLKPFRSSVPANATLPLPTPSGITPAAPSLSMPALTVVSPL